MIAAGIDVVLPVYWGAPYTSETWSDVGLPKLVAARQRLIEQGAKPPAIGMFYDTSSLVANKGNYRVDLRTPAGQRWFAATIRNFFSLIPPKDRALIDGKALIFLYAHGFAKGVDAQLFPAVRALVKRDLGVDIYLIKMDGWPGEADGSYRWGGALQPQFLDVAGFGPGYDHSAVPGRAPLVRKREDGNFYRRAWEQLLAMDPRSRPWLVHLETWNEFHEGTEICASAEHGRKYIELTRHFADLFHAEKRVQPTQPPKSPSTPSERPAKSTGTTAAPKGSRDGSSKQ
jgi:hypothetical protein